MSLDAEYEGYVNVTPNQISTSAASLKQDVTVVGEGAGHVIVTGNVTTMTDVNSDEAFVRITVMHSKNWDLVSLIVGWIYFSAWSVSFYPQMYYNFSRKR